MSLVANSLLSPYLANAQEVAEWEDNLEDEDDDAEGHEEPLSLLVEVGDPVDEAEHYRGLKDVERHLHNLLGE